MPAIRKIFRNNFFQNIYCFRYHETHSTLYVEKMKTNKVLDNAGHSFLYNLARELINCNLDSFIFTLKKAVLSSIHPYLLHHTQTRHNSRRYLHKHGIKKCKWTPQQNE